MTRIFRLSLLGPLALALPTPAAANDSVYTTLNLEACQVIERIEEGESIRWRCPGHATIPLLVGSGDGRFDIDAGVENDEFESLGEFNRPGPRVEWRLRGRVPIAIIYRLSTAGPESAARSVLFVETIGRPGAPGCMVARVDGRLRDANARARAAADRRAAGFRCGVDRPGER